MIMSETLGAENAGEEWDWIDELAEKTNAYKEAVQARIAARGLIANLRTRANVRKAYRVLHPKIPRTMRPSPSAIIVDTPEFIPPPSPWKNQEEFEKFVRLGLIEEPRIPPLNPNYQANEADVSPNS
jgi:hypothetical protein